MNSKIEFKAGEKPGSAAFQLKHRNVVVIVGQASF